MLQLRPGAAKKIINNKIFNTVLKKKAVLGILSHLQILLVFYVQDAKLLILE